MIESQWKLLQERLEASKDFTELARFHQEYVIFLVLWSLHPSFSWTILVQLYDLCQKNIVQLESYVQLVLRRGSSSNSLNSFMCWGTLICILCRYLAALITQSFLDIGSVSRILDSIINLCLQLCHIIEQEDGGLNLTELDRITEVCKIVHASWSEICAVCSSYNS